MKSERIGTCSNLGTGSQDYTRQIGLTPKYSSVVLTETSIAAHATSPFVDSTVMDLRRKYSGAVITIQATYNALAVLGVRIHVLSSPDGISWDTADYDTWDAVFVAGGTIQQSKPYDTLPAYLAVQIENLEAIAGQPVTSVVVTATSGG